MKHNIIPKALRCLAAAGLCLAAAACSKDDITPEPAPQEGIIPTQIIFNATRGGYEGDAETRAPKSEWAEGDVVYFGRSRYNEYNGKATYTDGKWVVTITKPITDNTAKLFARYAENSTVDSDGNLEIEHGDVAYTTSGSYKVDESGIITITINLDRHPQGRMTFTGVEPGKKLTVAGMKHIYRYYSVSGADPEFVEKSIHHPYRRGRRHRHPLRPANPAHRHGGRHHPESGV